MHYRLTPEDSDRLLHQPETGMGYQLIEASIAGNYELFRFIVYNAEIAVPFTSGELSLFHRLMQEERWSLLVARAVEMRFSAVTLLDRDGEERHRLAAEKSNGALDNPKETADGREIFVRISAWENDLRVDKTNLCLLPGSFTTTESDYNLCRTKAHNPVERYALPNEATIKWAFFIQPSITDILQRGIVQKTQDRWGGGAEAYFEKGSCAGSLKETREY